MRRIFIFPSGVIAVLGIGVGQIYIRAQLPFKREMSVSKSPVLAHFGAAIAGLGNSVIVVTGKL